MLRSVFYGRSKFFRFGDLKHFFQNFRIFQINYVYFFLIKYHNIYHWKDVKYKKFLFKNIEIKTFKKSVEK